MLPEQNRFDSTSGVHVRQSLLEIIGLIILEDSDCSEKGDNLPDSIWLASRWGLKLDVSLHI